MTVLVTGATGYVGHTVTQLLDENGFDVQVLARDSSATNHLPESVTVVDGDITVPETLDTAVANVDTVVHLAAKLSGDSERIQTVNVDGTETLLQKAEDADVQQFVFASTINAHPDLSVDSLSAYERSKATAEKRIVDADPSLDVSIFYPTYIVGPPDYTLKRYGYFKKVASNILLLPPMYSPGKSNLVHVSDVAGTVRHCVENADPELTRYMVTGENIAMQTLYQQIAETVDGRCTVVGFPYTVTKFVMFPLVDYLHDTGILPVGSEFVERTDLGTVPEEYANRAPVSQTSWETALAGMADWYSQVSML